MNILERSLWMDNARKVKREYTVGWFYHFITTTFLIYIAMVHVIPTHPDNHLLYMSIGFIVALNIFTIKFIVENRKNSTHHRQ